MTTTTHAPARTAHGPGWWATVGWWYAPACWTGRVLLWVVAWPVGVWRSARHGRKLDQARARRGR